MHSIRPRAVGAVLGPAFGFLCLAAICLPEAAAHPFACTQGERPLRLGFYAHFEPVSYNADRTAGSKGFDAHRGYEADLLSALEAIEGAKLSFTRQGIGTWNGIWLLPAGDRYDIGGGGITILESRTRDAAGKTAIVFTSGHIAFRQSLLVRAEDAERIARHGDLTGADRVVALADTTGEARFLELAGIADSDGVLAAGGIDAVARGEIGNLAVGKANGNAFAVTSLDTRAETGGFALAAEDAALAACFDRHIGRLTGGGRIGFPEWLEDPSVFMRRARQLDAGDR